jgi:hypothetical protein
MSVRLVLAPTAEEGVAGLMVVEVADEVAVEVVVEVGDMVVVEERAEDTNCRLASAFSS